MLITNGKIVIWGDNPEIIEGKTLHLQDGLIESIGDAGMLKTAYPQEEILDAGGQLVMAGNICAHTHILSRRLTRDCHPARERAVKVRVCANISCHHQLPAGIQDLLLRVSGL